MDKGVRAFSIQTPIFHAGDDLNSYLAQNLKVSLEGKVLAITSKLVSLAENRLVAKSAISKKDLVKSEADHYLCEGGYGAELTIKHGFLFASAGIDESNSETDSYILLPKDPYKSAEQIYLFLKNKFALNNFGVILTDSHSMPFRRGVTGIALAHWGFKATKSLIGQKDLFDQELKFTHVDVADSLASMAVFTMGEAADASPLAIVEGAEVEFQKKSSSSEIQISPKDDLYAPLFKAFLKNT
jgi:dihydrofolate synthase / folylpolyglutamate synthase